MLQLLVAILRKSDVWQHFCFLLSLLGFFYSKKMSPEMLLGEENSAIATFDIKHADNDDFPKTTNNGINYLAFL